MCSISCISARRSSASDHSRASRGRTITGRLMPNVMGPGTASCSSSSTGRETPRASARRASSARCQATGSPVRRIIDRRHSTDATGIRNRMVPATHADAAASLRRRRCGVTFDAGRRVDRAQRGSNGWTAHRLRRVLAAVRCHRHIDRHRGHAGDQDRQREQRRERRRDDQVPHRRARGSREPR